jgi:hypothetical protein
MSAMYVVSELTVTKMTTVAEKQCEKFEGRVGIYGHNEVDRLVTSYMAEFAVRQLYKQGGIDCHQNINNNDMPDLTIFAHKTLDQQFSKREEEVKCWKTGYSWEYYGNTITDYHASKYEAKGRARVWFCEVNRETRTVIVHGWATPAECLEAPNRQTSSGANHQLEVLHRVSEVMAWVDDTEDGSWF